MAMGNEMLIADGVLDKLAREALNVVEASDYARLCPVPQQDKVYRFLVMFNAAQWEYLKAQRQNKDGRDGRDGSKGDQGDQGEQGEQGKQGVGSSVSLFRGLICFDHVPANKLAIFVRMTERIGFWVVLAWVVFHLRSQGTVELKQRHVDSIDQHIKQAEVQ